MFKLQKIAAGAVGVSIILGLAAVAIPAGAQTTTFSSNLTVGSRGAEVSALQQTLINGGYLTAVTAPTGYFGAATKAALAKWQAASGITPAAGYFGPISRAYLNANGAVSGNFPAGCTSGAGYSSTTGVKCDPIASGNLPAGCMSTMGYSSTTGQKCDATIPGSSNGTWSPDGTDGSATVSYVSFAPASQTLKKGDTNKPVISIKLQAVNGKVNVSRFDVHFSERPWLIFGSLSLVDSTGKVLATKTLSGASDVTEVTVGSDYLVRFDNVSQVITPGSDVILAVNANVLAASDKITGQTVYVSVPTGSIRTINGKGYTDSIGLGATSQGGALNSTYGNAVTLSSTGSSASIYSRVSPNTPASRIVVTNATNNTNNVVLGVFGLKAQNQSATINSLNFLINTGTSTASYATTSLISNLRLQVGGQTYGANALSAGNTTFTNLNIALPVDQWTDVTLLADINSGYQSSNITASSTLVAATISGVDSNYNSLTVSTASNVTSNSVTFLQSGLQLSSPVATLGAAISGVIPGNVAGTVGYNTKYTFTLTNNGSSNVFVSKAAGAFLGTTTELAGTVTSNTASSSITSVTVSGDSLAEDTSTAWVIQAGGTRTFTFDGVLKSGGGGGVSRQTISKIYFNTAAANVGATSTANVIDFGLNSLTLSAGF